MLTGPDTEKGTAIDATIVPMDDGTSMFIKMTGPISTLNDQNEQLGEFLNSLKF